MTQQPATDRQVSYVKSLLYSHDLTGSGYDTPAWTTGIDYEGRLYHAADNMSKSSASKVIEDLKRLPFKPAQHWDTDDDPDWDTRSREARVAQAEQDAFGGLAEAFPADRSLSRQRVEGFAARVEAKTAMLATDKQTAYLRNLVDERSAPVDDREEGTVAGAWEALQEGTLTARQAGDAISILARQPRAAKADTGTPEVPAGRYAVEMDGDLKFYRVDRPTEGKWAGRTFVKVQASDEYWPVRGDAAKAVLAEIAKDPRAASLRYGHEIGACGICGRTLTDEDSRAAGIGPICAGNVGW
jgi:hypothetical protein